MSPAELEKTNIKISNNLNSSTFISAGEVIKFDGYLKLYKVSKEDETIEDDGILPPLAKNEIITLNQISGTEKFSRPPFRYSEASLVKSLKNWVLVDHQRMLQLFPQFKKQGLC